MDARARLERALEAVEGSGPPFPPGLIDELQAAAEAHYASEANWLAGLPPAIAAKLEGQHSEVLELIAALAGSPGSRDAPALAARLCALARHNLIEEDRDVAPYYYREI